MSSASTTFVAVCSNDSCAPAAVLRAAALDTAQRPFVEPAIDKDATSSGSSSSITTLKRVAPCCLLVASGCVRSRRRGKADHAVGVACRAGSAQVVKSGDGDAASDIGQTPDVRPVPSSPVALETQRRVVLNLAAAAAVGFAVEQRARAEAGATLKWTPMGGMPEEDEVFGQMKTPEWTVDFIIYLARILLNYDEMSSRWWRDEVLPSVGKETDKESRAAQLRDKFAAYAASVQFGLRRYVEEGRRDSGVLKKLVDRYGNTDEARRHLALAFTLLEDQPLEMITSLLAGVDTQSRLSAVFSPALADYLAMDPLRLLPNTQYPVWDRSLTRWVIPGLRSATPYRSSLDSADLTQSVFGPRGSEIVFKERELTANDYGLFALSGAVGCSFTHSLVIPLDVVKTRLQTNPGLYKDLIDGAVTIQKKEGWNGLTLGWEPTVLGYLWYGVTVYPGYEFFKRFFFAFFGQAVVDSFRVPLFLRSVFHRSRPEAMVAPDDNRRWARTPSLTPHQQAEAKRKFEAITDGRKLRALFARIEVAAQQEQTASAAAPDAAGSQALASLSDGRSLRRGARSQSVPALVAAPKPPGVWQTQVPPAQSNVAPAFGGPATPAVQTPNAAPSGQASLDDGRQLRDLSDGRQFRGGPAQQRAASAAPQSSQPVAPVPRPPPPQPVAPVLRPPLSQPVAPIPPPPPQTAESQGRWRLPVADPTQLVAPQSMQPITINLQPPPPAAQPPGTEISLAAMLGREMVPKPPPPPPAAEPSILRLDQALSQASAPQVPAVNVFPLPPAQSQGQPLHGLPLGGMLPEPGPRQAPMLLPPHPSMPQFFPTAAVYMQVTPATLGKGPVPPPPPAWGPSSSVGPAISASAPTGTVAVGVARSPWTTPGPTLPQTVPEAESAMFAPGVPPPTRLDRTKPPGGIDLNTRESGWFPATAVQQMPAAPEATVLADIPPPPQDVLPEVVPPPPPVVLAGVVPPPPAEHDAPASVSLQGPEEDEKGKEQDEGVFPPPPPVRERYVPSTKQDAPAPDQRDDAMEEGEVLAPADDVPAVQEQREATTGQVQSQNWRKYTEPESNRDWWCRLGEEDDVLDLFYVDTPGAWQRYLVESGSTRGWWWNNDTEAWFMEP